MVSPLKKDNDQRAEIGAAWRFDTASLFQFDRCRKTSSCRSK
jgi:hypothetical protein